MEILTFINSDMYLLVYLTSVLTIFIGFYYVSAKKQKQAFNKVNESVTLQQKTNQQLHLILIELKNANRHLANLGDLEPMEYSDKADYAPTSRSMHTQSMPSMGSGNQYKLYVGNIDYTATESELASHFAQFGQVEFVNIPVNRYTGKARGFGFVSFGSQDEAEQAMALHGSEFKGRQIQVNFAKERELA